MGEQPPDLRATIRTRGRRIDIVVLTLPAVAMCVGYLLPDRVGRSLAFSYTDPTLITAYTAHFVHVTPAHLLGNVLVYGLLAGTLYLLYLRADHRSLWLIFVLTVFSGFPVVLSGLNLAVERPAINVGASGLTTALLGGLPMAMAVVLDRRAPGPFARRYAPVLFLPPLLLIVLVGIPEGTLTGIALVGIVGGVGLYGQALLREYGLPRRETIGWLAEPGGDAELLAVAGVLLCGYPVVLFTGDPVGTTVPNHYSHLLGYCLAFLVAFIADQAGLVGP